MKNYFTMCLSRDCIGHLVLMPCFDVVYIGFADGSEGISMLSFCFLVPHLMHCS